MHFVAKLSILKLQYNFFRNAYDVLNHLATFRNLKKELKNNIPQLEFEPWPPG